jgi:hypothetical protein
MQYLLASPWIIETIHDRGYQMHCAVGPFISHRDWTVGELTLVLPSRDGTFRTGWAVSLRDWTCRQGMGGGVLNK